MEIAFGIAIAAIAAAIASAGVGAVSGSGEEGTPCEPLISNPDIFIAERAMRNG